MNTQELCYKILKISRHPHDRAAAIESSQFTVADLDWGLTDESCWVRLTTLVVHGELVDYETLLNLTLDNSVFVREEAIRRLGGLRDKIL